VLYTIWKGAKVKNYLHVWAISKSKMLCLLQHPENVFGRKKKAIVSTKKAFPKIQENLEEALDVQQIQ